MKQQNKFKLMLVLALMVVLSLVFVACQGEPGTKGDKGDTGAAGVGIETIAKQSSSGLVDTYVITYTDDSTSTFTVTNGANGTNGNNGTDGKDGISITNATINNSGELVLSFSKGNPINLGKVVGAKGDDGNDGISVTGASINSNDELILTFSQGNPINLGNVKGDKGDSAYALYKQNYNYTGTEQEWLDDLVNGRLATAEKFTIIFDTLGFTTAPTAQQVVYGGKVTKPADPTRENYRFDGWFVDGEKWSFVGYTVTQSLTLTAQWTQITVYSLSYETNGGTLTLGYPTEYNMSQNTPLPTPTREGYEFLGWFDNEDFVGVALSQIDQGTVGNKTLYANWQAISYTITYNTNGGTEVQEILEGFGVEDLPIDLTLVNTYKNDAHFDGWFMDEDLTIPAESITTIGNKTLYAKFTNATEGLAYTLNDTTYSVSGYTGSATDVVIADYHQDKPVAAIGNYAFMNNTTIQGIDIPTSVTTIGVRAYSGCSSLAEIFIPNSVTTIGDEAFYGCSEMPSINIPATVTVIGVDTFYNCTKLKKVYIEDMSAWLNIAFSDSDGNPLSNGADLYLNDAKVEHIVIPEGVTLIRQSAFYGCTSITSVTVPSSLQLIHHYAFNMCSNIKSLYISDLNAWLNVSVYSPVVGSGKLYLNGELVTTLEIPDETIAIKPYSFYGITSIQTVSLSADDQLQTIGDYAFYGCSNLTTITFPSSLQTIGSYSFAFCKLDTIKIPASVSEIGSYAFNNCQQATNIIFEEGSTLSVINSFTFSNCSALQSVVIPASVVEIKSYAFSCYDSQLQIVYYGGTSAEWTTLASSIESGNENLTNATCHYYSQVDPYTNGSAVDGEIYWHYASGVPTIWTKPAE